MLLIISDIFDAHADRVIVRLEELGIAYFRLNLDVESLLKTLMTFDGAVWNIKTPNGNFVSSHISCVWIRKYFVELSLQERAKLNSVDFKIWKNEFNATLIGLYISLKSLPWLNPISNAIKGDNKYYQMSVANTLDLKMPRTIVSNDKAKLINFAKSCDGDIIFKLLNQDLYEVDKNGSMQGIYANRIKIENLEKFSIKGENPIMLQEYVIKSYEVRYTVVGSKHFACKIQSQQSKIACEDWRRYDLSKTPHLPITPPLQIKQKINKLLKTMGLEYGAIDFIVTPQNEWIFLEINCGGQWLWIEDLSGLNISGGIIEWVKMHLYSK